MYIGDRVKVMALIPTSDEVLQPKFVLNDQDKRRGYKQLAKYLYLSTPIWGEKRLKLRKKRHRDPLTGAAKNDHHFELYPGEVIHISTGVEIKNPAGVSSGQGNISPLKGNISQDVNAGKRVSCV